MNEIWIDPDDDASELVKALVEEGYAVTENRTDDPTLPWFIVVDPFDDGVFAMVDVYGGRLPDED
ncbi:MAG TPA: hypothetical protein VLI04_02640 [Nocardioidaceae bacterium]|nr:hypothetical protein [Nocardioidaceae bacterium]